MAYLARQATSCPCGPERWALQLDHVPLLIDQPSIAEYASDELTRQLFCLLFVRPVDVSVLSQEARATHAAEVVVTALPALRLRDLEVASSLPVLIVQESIDSIWGHVSWSLRFLQRMR